MARARKPEIKLAFIGHSNLSVSEARALASKYLDRVCNNYKVLVLVTIKDDVMGRAARRYAKTLGIPLETMDRTTNDHNFLPMELTVGSLMWAADRFILVRSESKKEYSYMAREMCERMPRKYISTK